MIAGLSPFEAAYVVSAVFLAGAVRGFAGFALSAMIMATCVIILPPVELIPVCTLLEIATGLMLLRGGFAQADKWIVTLLQAGSLIGVPTGLWLTLTLDPGLSRVVALVLLMGLAALQLAQVPLPVGKGPVGTFATGIVSGMATGLASIGGMVVALYTLGRRMEPARMRGSLILMTMVGGMITTGWQLLYGMMSGASVARTALLVLPCLAGAWLGARGFTPANQRHYRRICLILLLGLAGFGLVRLWLA